MASQLKVDTITGVTTAGSISVTGEGNSTTTNLQSGLAKVILYYDLTNNANRQSVNVSSVTDHGTGNMQALYTNPVVGNGIAIYLATNGYYGIGETFGSSTNSHYHRIRGDSAYSTLVDVTQTHHGVFGELA